MAAPLARGTYAAPIARAKLAFACAHGMGEAEVLALLETTAAELDDPDARLPVAPAMRFWAHLARRLDDPGLPVRFAASLSASDVGVLGFAALTAGSAREAMARAIKYYAVLADTAQLVATERTEGVRIELVRPGERTLALRLMNENTLACILQIVRRVTRTRVVPASVAFRHPAPRDVAAHGAFFGVAPVFGAAGDWLVLPAAALERVPPSPDAAMTSFFEHHAQRVLARIASDEPLAARVRSAIAQALTGGVPSMAAIARRLGTSDRTLRRALDREGIGFRALIDDVRRELAAEYLATSRATIAETAFLLGFSEASAFSRAFRRWYGRAPRDHARASATPPASRRTRP
jgi:AraC-like DNA-binding protein